MIPTRRRTLVGGTVLAAAILLVHGPARAADAPAVPPTRDAAADPAAPRPAKAERIQVEIPKVTRTYVEKTSAEDRERARKLFTAGNKAFEQRQVDRSLKLYEQAYAIWPHPRVLFNKAVSLGFLGRPLESARAFKEVLEYGPDPITQLRYKQAAERYLELMGQLASLVVNCTDVGAKLYVNGEPIGEAPMSKKVTLGPGTHMITANLGGKVPYSAQVRLGPGELKRVTVSLQAFSDVVRYRMVSRYHWAWPTAVSSVAAAALGVGLGLLMKGRSDVGTVQQAMDDFYSVEANRERPFLKDTNLEKRGVNFQYGGWVLVGTAGVTAAAAVVLWVLQKKRVRYTVGADAEGGGVKISF